MKMQRLHKWLATALLVALPTLVLAQLTEIGGIGNIFEKRASSKTETKKNTRATPTPKASPTPPAQGQRAQGAPQPGQPGTVKPGQPRSVPAQGQAQAKPAAKPGSGAVQAPANTGQLRIVTKDLAESVKTRLVEYDEDALRTSGTAIILSPRRYKPELSSERQSGNSSNLRSVSGL
ncbi:MAG: hypothetical protein ACP5UB_05295 [Candidatus Sumerlaeaceae bacterium]